ncbi:5-formyltetrahydrofolate cyclo-ligase [Mycobacterium sp.]|uniref:5-formyltetrahydrofolate cyclo-ligase n=1 Tax=Mycobacterium sp. TaxID=1785 RepID=UPI0031E12DA0
MPTTGKAALRERLLAARRSVPDEVHAAEARALSRHITELAAGLVDTGGTVCAYVPVGAEPGSIDMLEVLRRRAARVLVPVARTGEGGAALQLRWGEYRPGHLVAGPFGLLEPPEPWLPASALADAAVVLVPALAVDWSGVRLGRGGGFYDRSLVGRHPQARLAAVIRDGELVDVVPSEPHDVPMTHAVTPARGVVALGAASK